MSTIRTTLILLLMLPLAGALAQETAKTETTTTAAADTATTTNATTTAQEADEPRALSAYEVRNQFTRLLGDNPSELWMILKLDPSLMTNEAFMSGYPEVAKFLARHPEIQRNPRFYLAEFLMPGQQQRNPLDNILEALAIVFGFGLATFVFTWFVRTLIEQRRWNRLTRTQTEVHNKILDRFGSSQEVLDYIKTPAGTKFLEAAPIALHADKPGRLTPHSRIVWSIQLGIIVAVAALGMLLVSLRFAGETSQGLFAMGMIGFSLGAGFVASALVSLKFSRRLAPPPGDEEELVR